MPLALIALIPNLVVVVVLVVLLGACAGMAYVTGYTIVGWRWTTRPAAGRSRSSSPRSG